MDESLDDPERRDEVNNDDQNTDIDFVYNDADEYSVEIAELYSYSEEPDFRLNKESFEGDFHKFVSVKWFEASCEDRHAHIVRLLDRLESSNRSVRQKTLRALLYLLQGNFGDCELEEDQITWARRNVYLCIEAGLLSSIIQILLLEIEYDKWNSSNTSSESNTNEPNSDGGDKEQSAASTSGNRTDTNTESLRKTANNLADSTDLRVIFSILYIMAETVRDGMITDQAGTQTTAIGGTGDKTASGQNVLSSGITVDSTGKLREQFCEELASPIFGDGDPTLTVVLFGMVHRFCSGSAPHYPIKKVLLLLWKVLLSVIVSRSEENENSNSANYIGKARTKPSRARCALSSLLATPRNQITLGPLSGLFTRKNEARARYGLPPLFEDACQVIRRVRANSPPGTSADQLLGRVPRNNNRHANFGQSNQAPRQGTLAGGRFGLQQRQQLQQPAPLSSSIGAAAGSSVPATPDPSAYDTPGFATPRPGSPVNNRSANNTTTEERAVEFANGNRVGVDTPMPGAGELGATSGVASGPSQQPMLQGLSTLFANSKGLPWKPKVRKKDLENFLTNARLKFVGFPVPNDTSSLAGLPEPIHEAVKVMREHLYVSLGEMQIQRECEIARNPMSMGREEIPDTPVERLYRAMYPLLPQYMIALLKVLLAAAPTSRTKTEPINILAEVMPPEISPSVIQQAILNADINRHRELIVKAISALLLLLLKHMKLNHIYQFEYVSQYLVFANCIPLILKFFNQDTRHYVQAKNTLSFLDFPTRLIGKSPELTPEMLTSDWSSYCWRNLFACINLLRILNMLTKWKHSRTMLLVVFKSAPILKRALRVRHAMMQLYVLKLLKLQSRYFGRQWRKNNMSIMSAIYQKVRHRLTDDWAYGNDVDAMPWQFQVEECTLRTNVDRFNQRRYSDDWLDPEFRPVDNCLTSLLSKPFRLSDEFKRNYEKWLEEEVFSVPINWAQVLAR